MTYWDSYEKQLFLLLTKDYSKLIRNNASDAKSIQLKNKAWEEIHEKFNKLNTRLRDINQLKIQWKRMKIRARKNKHIKLKKERNKTDEGGRPTSPTDEMNQDGELLQTADLLGDSIIIDDVETESPCLHNENVFRGPYPSKSDPMRLCHTADRYEVLLDHDYYINELTKHSRTLKDNEHIRLMEMAEEEHEMKMEIHRENLKTAILEREMLEMKKLDFLKNTSNIIS